MPWISLTVISYFLSALAATLDKILISSRIPNPVSYTFYIGILSVGVLVLAPLGFVFLSFSTTVVAFSAGAAFLASLYFLFSALRDYEASRVMPLVGGTSPLFSLILEVMFLSKFPTLGQEMAPILFFVGAAILLSLEPVQGITRINYRLISLSLLSAFFMALTFFLSKEVFTNAPFIPAFIWIRLGSFFAAILMLALPNVRRDIFQSSLKTRASSFLMLVSNKGLGALGFLLLNYSIAIGPVSVINAMKGLEYLFIFLLTLLFTYFLPQVLKEPFDFKGIIFKISGIIFIGMGFVFLLPR